MHNELEEPIRPVVFITGAGASADYGFPLGRELATYVRNVLGEAWNPDRLSEFGPLVKATENLSVDERAAASIVLRGSLDYFDSIDRLLTNRATNPNVVSLGRALIAYSISRRENEMWDHRARLPAGGYASFDQCFQHTSTFPGWLSEFARASELARSPERAAAVLSATSFITFNYDRTIEHMLAVLLAQIHGLEEMKRLIRKIEVIHVYGDLGAMLQSEVDDYPFGEMRVPMVRDRIRLFSDPFLEQALLSRIRFRTTNAARVAIIGFGFDPFNVERLAVEPISAPAWITSRPEISQMRISAMLPDLRRQGEPNGTSLLRASGSEIFGNLAQL